MSSSDIWCQSSFPNLWMVLLQLETLLRLDEFEKLELATEISLVLSSMSIALAPSSISRFEKG